MTIRELPSEEWGKVEGHPALGGVKLDPSNAVLFVAENEAGEIIGVQGITLVLHLEPAWTAPDHRGSTIAYRLFDTARQKLDDCRVNTALCYTDQPEVKDYLTRVGLKELPYTSFLYEGHPV